MVANYPTIVRKFRHHVDGTEYVMAAHVNEIQDEVSAVEGTLGTKPHVYHPPTGSDTAYSSVAVRLNAMQALIYAQQKQIDDLLDASRNGWKLPLVSVYASGTSVPPSDLTNGLSEADWYNLRWNKEIFDTDGAFSSGNYITIPKTGWWIVHCNSTMFQPVTNPDIQHSVFMRVRVKGAVAPVWYICQAGSTSTVDRGLWHRLSASAASDFYAGDQLYVDMRHQYVRLDGSGDKGEQTLTGQARLQMTYIRALPTGPATNRASFALPDES